MGPLVLINVFLHHGAFLTYIDATTLTLAISASLFVCNFFNYLSFIFRLIEASPSPFSLTLSPIVPFFLLFFYIFPLVLPPLRSVIVLLILPSTSAPLRPLSFLSLIFTHSLTLLFPSHSPCLWFWAMFTKHIGTGWWSMSFAMITLTHMQTHPNVRAHTDLLEIVVDEQCQTLSIHAYQSCSRNLIRPPGRSVALALILANLPFSLGDEFEVLWLYTFQHPQS